ncbi:hypothetical protein DPMN_054799 [Dreissena polymorpha]|uniref:2'-5'-oligoadenylate synthetase 1 domain-containing protein n=2 Tax=Dreissena polymorpha TaxID=45954 RepID=A0A9D4CPK1_DREPO|nr:hypothetical protein DPMN_054799 [Dreissena polymorpha]
MDKEAFPTVDSLKEGMEDLLSTLKTSLTHQQSKRDVIVEWDKTTKHSVQVTLTDNDGLRHSIDMLPAVDLKLDDAESVRNIFKQMEQSDSETKAFYSASLAPLQVELVRALPTKVKSLIRLIKFWNKEKVKPVLKDLCPTSYVYEVIIMDAWAKAKRPSNFDMKRAAHAVMTKLRNYKIMRICTPGIALYKRKSDKKGNKTAFIMDPCNPTNDIYNNRQFNWKGMSAEAKKWLNKPVFAGVSKTSKSW